MIRRLTLGLVVALAVVGCGSTAPAPVSSPSAGASAAASPSVPTASPVVTLPADAPASASDELGPLRLDLVLAKSHWKIGEPITGTITLTNTGPTINVTSSSQRLAVKYAEVGSKRLTRPVWPADCASGPFDPAKPVTSGLTKSGGYAPDNPDDAWLKTFFEGDGVQLPAGLWDVTAESSVTPGAGCVGGLPSMDVTVRVEVGG